MADGLQQAQQAAREARSRGQGLRHLALKHREEAAALEQQADLLEWQA